MSQKNVIIKNKNQLNITYNMSLIKNHIHKISHKTTHAHMTSPNATTAIPGRQKWRLARLDAAKKHFCDENLK